MNKKVSLEELEPFISAQLAEGGSVTFTVKGTSMRPMLIGGIDAVTIVKPTEPLKK